jgi:16S rRNA (guanine527-N7)-methyltransferase
LPGHVIRSALEPYGVALTGAQIDAIRRYIGLLLLWNQKVNMTSITDPREILERHFGESMFAAGVVPIHHGRLADVGSGAGFPALAIKLVCPDLHVILIEANGKKAAFLGDIKRLLDLAGVEIVRSRLEELQAGSPYADFVSARALGSFQRLLRWSRGALRENGRILLWLGADDALKISKKKGWIWQELIPIPRSRRRVLLVGAPTSE